MEKISSITLSSCLVLILLVGCSSNNPHPNNPTTTQNAIYTKIHNHNKLKEMIKSAAKEKGWRITEFKENALIAEKFDDENPKATTIKLNDGYIDFDNNSGTSDGDIVDLRDYIEDYIRTKQEEAH